MFDMKRSLLRAARGPRFLAAMLLLGLFAAACGGAEGARGWAAPVRTDTLLLVSAGTGRIDGVDPATREEKWRFPRSWQMTDSKADDLKGIYGDPVVARDGSVYVGDYNGRVYVFRPGDFKPDASEKPRAGSLDLKAPIIGGIALDEANNLLFVTAGDSLYSVNTRDLITRIQDKSSAVKTSKLLETGGDIWAAPQFANGRVYVASLDGNLYAVDATTGKEAWRFSGSRGLASKPELNSGTLYVGGFGGKLYAVDASSGERKWTSEAASWVWSRTVVSGSRAYFGDFEGNLYAVDASNGKEAWRFGLDKGSIRSAVAVTSNTVVVATDEGWLAGISLDGSNKVWERKIESPINADLVVSGDTVYLSPERCVTADGDSKTFYVTVDPRNGELGRASGVC